MRNVIIILLVFVQHLGFGQTGEELLEKISKNYEDLSSMEILYTYTLYKGHKGKDLREQYESNYFQQGDRSIRKLGPTETISLEDMTITIDHNEKEIFVSKPMIQQHIDLDYKSVLSNCKDSKVIEKKGGAVLQLWMSANANVPFSRLEITIDNNYWITDMQIFYTTLMNFSGSMFEKEMGLPRLNVNYTSLKKKWKDKEGITNKEHYMRSEGDTLVVSDHFQNYTLTDLRSL